MRGSFTILLMAVSLVLKAQQDSAVKKIELLRPTYVKNSVTATMALGFIDGNRQNYTVPAGFSLANISGFVPFFAKLEYGLSNKISLGATFSYDAMVYNILQEYNGNNGAFNRYKTNNARIFSGGLVAYYHIAELLHSRRLDPFVGVGLSLNNLRFKAQPQGDSTVIKTDHIVTPYVKVGARYYITNQFSVFGDAGYDKQSIITIGFSCRFFTKFRL